MKLALAGLVLGILESVSLAGMLSSQLYGVAPRDPVVLAGVAVFVVLLASLASFLPARRAARVNPIESLRSE